MKKKGLLVLVFCLYQVMGWAYSFEVDGIYYTISYSSEVSVTFGDKKYSGDIVIPESVTYEGKKYQVTTIGESAFSYCSSLTSIVFPDGVTRIEGKAFYGCTALTSVTLPDEIYSWGFSPFLYCSSLISITVSEANPYFYSVDGVLFNKEQTEIIAFPGGRTSFEIPEKVRDIGSAFFGSISLLSITVSEANPYFYSVDGVLFDKGLNNIIAFPGGRTSYRIPEWVDYIDSWAFGGCVYLTSLTLPNGMPSSGKESFEDCFSLKSIYSLLSTPNSWWGMYIPNELYSNCTVYVPVGSRFSYMNTEYWENFENIVEMDFTSIEMTTENCLSFLPDVIDLGFTLEGISNATITIYSLSGAQVMQVVAGEGEFISLASLPAGAYVMRMQMGRSVVDKKVIKRN